VKQPVERTGGERDRAVVGFGSDIPAFLQRAVPVSQDTGADSDA
jgi:hypothetical protein